MNAPTIVMLPGALMALDEFAQAGFSATLAQHWPEAQLELLPIDVNQLDVHACVDALHAQLTPLRETRQASPLLLGGISLGAAVSLHYAREFPDHVDGLCLLAPYPGSRITIQAIRQAGDLTAWQPDAAQRMDAEFLLWEWLRDGHGGLPIYLGHGREDRFADGQAMMQEAAANACCSTVPGGHDWSAWQALWLDFVQQRDYFNQRFRR